MYNTDAKSKVFSEIQKSGQGSTQSSDMEADVDSPEYDCGENVSESCQCTCAYSPVISNLPRTSTPVKSQLVIMSSTEMPFSSDDLFSLDVSKYDKDNNPWGEMDVNQIPSKQLTKG